MMETGERPTSHLVQQVVLVDARCDSIVISWEAQEDAVCYILEYRTVSPLEPDFQRLAEDIQGTSSRKRNLLPETQYFFRVAPVYADDHVGPWVTHREAFETLSQEQDEDYAMAAPIVTVPSEPHALIITWEEVEEEIAGFELQMRENKGGARWFSFETSGNQSEVKKKNLKSPWGYQFRVRPVTDYEEPFSPPSNAVQPRRPQGYTKSQKPYVPPRPRNHQRYQPQPQYQQDGYYSDEEEYYNNEDPYSQKAPQRQYGNYDEELMPAPWFKSAGEGTALICWQKQDGCTGYELQMKEVLPGLASNEGWYTIAARLSGTEVKKKNLISANGYQFRVRPLDGPCSGKGYSNPSNPVILPQSSRQRAQARQKTDAAVKAFKYSMPAPWFKGAGEKHSIIVCWQKQAGVTGYELQMKECANGEQWKTIAKRLTGTEVKKRNLSSASGYQFRVKPVDGPNAHKPFSLASATAIAR